MNTIETARTHGHCHSCSTYQLKIPIDNKKVCERQETLVIGALIKLENRVDVPRSGEVAEDYLVRTDAHNGTIFCEQ